MSHGIIITTILYGATTFIKPVTPQRTVLIPKEHHRHVTCDVCVQLIFPMADAHHSPKQPKTPLSLVVLLWFKRWMRQNLSFIRFSCPSLGSSLTHLVNEGREFSTAPHLNSAPSHTPVFLLVYATKRNFPSLESHAFDACLQTITCRNTYSCVSKAYIL